MKASSKFKTLCLLGCIGLAAVLWISYDQICQRVRRAIVEVGPHERGPFLRGESSRLDGYDSADTRTVSPPASR
jgi:hypothetical protein